MIPISNVTANMVDSQYRYDAVGIYANVSAAEANSKLLNLYKNETSKASVDLDGNMYANNIFLYGDKIVPGSGILNIQGDQEVSGNIIIMGSLEVVGNVISNEVEEVVSNALVSISVDTGRINCSYVNVYAPGVQTLVYPDYINRNGYPFLGMARVQFFRTPGSFVYTPLPGVRKLLVELWGAGGGAGGGICTTVTSVALGGYSGTGRMMPGPGGGGEYAMGIFDVLPEYTFSYIVGAAGLGGVGNADGVSGGWSGFYSSSGQEMDVAGGGGGKQQGGSGNADKEGGDGGQRGTGGSGAVTIIRIAGTHGIPGKIFSSVPRGSYSGFSAVFGGGVLGTVNGNGTNGLNPGEGGGSPSRVTAGSMTGGNGNPGAVKVTEYF